MIISPFHHDKSDIFGLVGRQTLGIYKHSRVQAIRLATEYNSPLAFLVNTFLQLLLHGLHTYRHGDTLGIIFIKMTADACIKRIEIIVTPLPTGPVYLRKWRVMISLGMKLIHTFVRFNYSGSSRFVIVVCLLTFHVTAGHPVGVFGL